MHFEIVKYWSSQHKRLFEIYESSFILDYCEPSCFACGQFWNGSYDVKDERLASKAWLSAPLEKAHLKPKAKGGSNEPPNLVLLCADCHKKSPDTDCAEKMLFWCLTQESFFVRELKELEKEMMRFGISLEEVDNIVLNNKNALLKLVSTHFGGGVKTASWIAASVSIKEGFS